MAELQSMRISEHQHTPNGLSNAHSLSYMHSIPKRRAWQQLYHLTRRALEAQGPGPFGPSGAACALLVDTIATRISVCGLSNDRWQLLAVLGLKSKAPDRS